MATQGISGGLRFYGVGLPPGEIIKSVNQSNYLNYEGELSCLTEWFNKMLF